MDSAERPRILTVILRPIAPILFPSYQQFPRKLDGILDMLQHHAAYTSLSVPIGHHDAAFEFILAFACEDGTIAGVVECIVF